MSYRKRKPPVGSRPGTLALPEGTPAPKIRVMHFNAESFDERELDSAETIHAIGRKGLFTWIDVQGLGDEETLWALAKRFDIHLLALEDIVHVPQRPKTETHGPHQLTVVRMVQRNGDGALALEQLSVLLGEDYVITFEERYGHVLDPVRKRLRDATGQMRKRGVDYLAYAIIDTVIDGYFPIVEELGDAVEELETQVITTPSVDTLNAINALRSDVILVRRTIWAHREVLSSLERESLQHIEEATRIYYRDTYDHTIQLAEVLESQRDTVSSLVNTYLSAVSQRTNEIMKVLTMMTSIFIPLSFLAGVYGMNFDHMPELHAPWGYPVLWLVMVTIASTLLYFFRRKGWLGRGQLR